MAHRLKVGGSVEGVAAAEEQLDEVAGDVASGNIESLREVVEDDGFVNGDNVGNTVARVDNDARAQACAILLAGAVGQLLRAFVKTYPGRKGPKRLEWRRIHRRIRICQT